MKGLIALFKFTTRLPLGNSSNFTEDGVGKSMKFFPFVGIILGLIMYTAHTLLSLYINSSMVIAAVIVVIYVILTGALHLDGLSDTFDGIFSYRSKQRMLEIMKDSRVGANGVIDLVIYFIHNIIFLADLESIELPMGAFILLYPVVGRMNTVINCATAPYARTSGMAKDFVEQTDYKGFLISFLITMGYAYAVLTYFKLNISIISIVPIMAILGYYFARLMTRKIGGVTGDTLGAVLELTQVVMLFLLYFIV